eukprot:1601719-Amphidinium_carterae.1
MDFATHHRSSNYTFHRYSNNLVYLQVRSDQCVYHSDDITIMVYDDSTWMTHYILVTTTKSRRSYRSWSHNYN